jgi:riboflavin kinase/FMN adenylyltransferase
MHVFSALDAVALNHPQAVTIGVFDGVHRGHHYLLQQTAEVAAGLGAEVTVLTFWPPPILVLRPEKAATFLTLPEEKEAVLRQLGIIAHEIVLPFTPALAQWSPDAFLAALQARMPLSAIVEGDDFTLGHNRAGTIEWLQAYGKTHGIVVEQVARRATAGQPISSTRIRGFIAEGALPEAVALLGRPYRVQGEVVHGDGRGRGLGFPTANLKLDPLKLIPANGIYAVRAWDVATPAIVWQGAANVGVRPTFGGEERRVEVFLMDVDLDLYGATLCVEWVQRLREERAFATVPALIAQMTEDVRQARHLLQVQETGDQL